MIFEGDYLDGKRNGKGKVYSEFESKLIFEGEYENDKIIKGKEYFGDKGKLLFEGEYKNEEKWNGKGYDKKGKILYELHNGNGYIKEYFSNGKLEYEGEIKNGKRNGKGREYDPKGKLEFIGE